METTRVYHESFAYLLKDQGFEVSNILPDKISNHAGSLIAAIVLAETAH
jgi:transposase